MRTVEELKIPDVDSKSEVDEGIESPLVSFDEEPAETQKTEDELVVAVSTTQVTKDNNETVTEEQPSKKSYSEKYQEEIAVVEDATPAPILNLKQNDTDASVAQTASSAKLIEEMRVVKETVAETEPAVPIALDDTRHKSSHEFLMSKSSKKQPSSKKHMYSIQSGSRPNSQSRWKGKTRRMAASRSAASVQVDRDGFVTVKKFKYNALYQTPLVPLIKTIIWCKV